MVSIVEQAQKIAKKYLIESLTLEEQIIRIDASHAGGFPFSLRSTGLESILEFGCWHQPFANQDEALAVFERCLSGEAQVRHVTNLGIVYKGVLEVYKDFSKKPEVQYVHGVITMLFLFPFPKREKVYKNSFPRIS